MLQVFVEIKIVRRFDIESCEPLTIYHLFSEDIIEKAPVEERFLEFSVIRKNFKRHCMPFCQLIQSYSNKFVFFFDDVSLHAFSLRNSVTLLWKWRQPDSFLQRPRSSLQTRKLRGR